MTEGESEFFEKLLHRLRLDADEGRSRGRNGVRPVTEAEIESAEQRMGIGFPPQLRQFYRTAGCGRLAQRGRTAPDRTNAIVLSPDEATSGFLRTGSDIECRPWMWAEKELPFLRVDRHFYLVARPGSDRPDAVFMPTIDVPLADDLAAFVDALFENPARASGTDLPAWNTGTAERALDKFIRSALRANSSASRLLSSRSRFLGLIAGRTRRRRIWEHALDNAHRRVMDDAAVDERLRAFAVSVGALWSAVRTGVTLRPPLSLYGFDEEELRERAEAVVTGMRTLPGLTESSIEDFEMLTEDWQATQSEAERGRVLCQ